MSDDEERAAERYDKLARRVRELAEEFEAATHSQFLWDAASRLRALLEDA